MTFLIRWTQFLGIRDGEHSRFAWLFAHSLSNGICTAFLFSAAYALFLDRFDATDLPWAYIASAFAGYAVVAVFSRLERELTFARLLMYQLYFVLAFILTFWAAASLGSSPWPVFLMFVAVGPLLTLLELEYWGVAVRLFDLRQGKRLFNLVSAGGALASIAGFFLVPVMVGTTLIRDFEDLLGFAAFGVGLSIIAVREIGRKFADQLEIRSAGAEPRNAGRLADLARDRYFVLLAVLVVAVVLTFYLVDLGFLAEIETRYPGAALAAFLGQFYGAVKLLELAFRTFLSGRLVSQFGVRFGLLSLPVALLAVVGLTLLAERFAAGTGVVFMLVVAAKLVWLVLRKAIFDGAFKVLYQPLEGARKFAFQARLEGTVSPAVTLAVGVALLVYSRQGVGAVELFYVVAPLLLVWIGAGVLLHGEYRERLLSVLAREVEKGTSETPAERIRQRLLEAPPEDFDYLAGVLERVDPTAVSAALVEAARRGVPELDVRVLRRVEERRDFDAMEAVEQCAADGDREVRAAAARTLETLRRIAGLAESAERLAPLLESRRSEDRELAAVALGYAATAGFAVVDPGELTGLLWDRDPRVRRAALLAAGRWGDPRLWSRILSHLASPVYAATATTALVALGEPVLGELEAAFGRSRQDTDVRLRILKIYDRIGGPLAGRLILDKLHFPDKAVRYWTLVALAHAGFQPAGEDVPVIKNEIEDLVAAVAWNSAAILDLGEEPATLGVRKALSAENAYDRELLLLLLSLLFDPRAIDLVRRNLRSGQPDSVVYALEILDVVVSADVKPMLFPVVEELTPAKAVKRLEPFFPRQRMGRRDRLAAIAFRSHDAMNNWTRACALLALAEMSSGEVDDVLVANVFHPDPMMQEVAAGGIQRVDPRQLERHLERLPTATRERLVRLISTSAPDAEGGVARPWESRSIFGRIAALRELRAFATLPWQAVTGLAGEMDEIATETGQSFPPPDDPPGTLYLLVEGRLGFYAEGGGLGVVASTALVACAPGARPARVLEAGRAFRFTTDRVYELTAVHGDLVPAVLNAASPTVVEEVASLSQSLETSISLMPTH